MSESNRNPPILIIVFILGIIALKTFAPKLFDQNMVRGEGFTVRKPDGWSMTKDKFSATFICPERDLLTEAPLAMFSIYAEKQQGALFMEDFFPEVMALLQKQDGKILNVGEEPIDGVPAKRVMFRYNHPDIAVVTLFIIDDYNRLIKIQFSGSTKEFKAYGKKFDEFKKTIKLKKGFGAPAS